MPELPPDLATIRGHVTIMGLFTNVIVLARMRYKRACATSA
jgi:hypothetical protein